MKKQHRNWNVHVYFGESFLILNASIIVTTFNNCYVYWLVTGWWFSPSTPVSSTKTDRHDITEILLKVALDTIKQTKQT